MNNQAEELKQYGIALRTYRKARGYRSQDDFAHAIGVSRGTVSNIERGVLANLNEALMAKVDEVLDATLPRPKFMSANFDARAFGDIAEASTDPFDLLSWFSSFAARHPQTAEEVRRFVSRVLEATANSNGDDRPSREFLRQQAHQVWQLVSDMYAGVSMGAIRIKDITSMSIIEALIKKAATYGEKGEVYGVNTLSPNTLWATPQGKNYLQANREVIEADGKVERVFIFKSFDDEVFDEMLDVLNEHIEGHIPFYVVTMNMLTPNLVRDLLVVKTPDEKIIARVRPGLHDAIISSEISTHKDEVREGLQVFEELKKKGEEQGCGPISTYEELDTVLGRYKMTS